MHVEYACIFQRVLLIMCEVRSRDKSQAVRLEVAECCSVILKKRANYLKVIEGDQRRVCYACMYYVCMNVVSVSVSVESFVSLLRDGDWEIRLFVLVPFSIYMCMACLYVCSCLCARTLTSRFAVWYHTHTFIIV